MQHSSKLSKTRSWAPSNTVNTAFNQSTHRDDSNTRTAVPLGGRKPGFFAQLFSSKSTTAVIEPPNGSSFVNLSRKTPSPIGKLNSIPPNLAIRSLSPDLLNDPAFSTNPLSHPLFVTNPDSYTDPLPSKFGLNENSPANMTESRTQDPGFASPYYDNDPVSFNHPSSHSPPSEPSSLEGMGTNTSSTSHSSASLEAMNGPSAASSYTDITTSSSASAGAAGELPKKNLIVLEPPRILSPPPAYDEPSQERPSTVRHSSVPTIPSLQPKRIEVPPRPATTANDSRNMDPRRHNTDINPSRRNRGLDPIDELDESNPLGLSLHHGGPYEAIKKVTQPPREPQNISHSNPHQATRKASNLQPFPTAHVAAITPVPFGAPLNLTPGQILPRNYQPYIQPTLQKPDHFITYQQGNNPNQQVLRPQPAHQNQRIFNLQAHAPQLTNQHPLPHIPQSQLHSSQGQPPTGIHLYTQQSRPQPSTQRPSHLETHATASHPGIRPPSPLLKAPKRVEDDANSIYDDEQHAYDGIEEEEFSLTSNPPSESTHPKYISTHVNVKSADVPQTYSDSVATTGVENDAVARALYAVERARAQRSQEPSHGTPVIPPKFSSGFSAFNEGPPISDRLEAISRNVPPLPPGASYKPAPGRYEPQTRPSEQFKKQKSSTPYIPISASHYQSYRTNQSDGWHRRATSLEPGFNPYVVQQPQRHPTDPGRQMTPASGSPYSGQTYDRRIHDMIPNGAVQHYIKESYSRPQQLVPPDSGSFERPVRSQQPAPSIQQSISSTNSKNVLPPRHLPSKLTMPQPLYKPDAPPAQNDLMMPSNNSRSHFQPPQHGTGVPRPMPVKQAHHPAMHTNPPDSFKVQAQTIPMATDLRKVLRKRGSVQAVGPGFEIAPAVSASTSNVPGLHAPIANVPPTRSKSEIGPPTVGNRMPLLSIPPDKKAPRKLLSKKRAEF